MNMQSPFFDRQERIGWWKQDSLLRSRVLVVGAGALGNEVIKNLSLLGVGNLLIADFDTIENSNLSRAVLFRHKDVKNGARKADVAARRAKLLNPNPKAIVKSFHGDIVWDMGLGVFRYADVIVGCLDNIEARLAVNLACRKLGKTWIDGGMWELAGSVSVYDCKNDDKACYECGMTPDHYRDIRVRYSCTNAVVKARIKQGYEPTTQTTSALVGAFQSQETVKLLHNMPSFSGRRLMINGEAHFFTGDDSSPVYLIDLSKNPSCLCHQESIIEDVFSIQSASADTKLGDFFDLLHKYFDNTRIIIELNREFVVSAECPYCLNSIYINKPLHRTNDLEVVCPNCEVDCPTCGTKNIGVPDCRNCGQEDIYEPILHKFNELTEDSSWFKNNSNLTLLDIGVPPLQILRIISDKGQKLVEITGDKTRFWK